MNNGTKKNNMEEKCKSIMRMGVAAPAKISDHREKGGQPFLCPVFDENMKMVSGEELAEIHSACSNGDILCGECKKATTVRIRAIENIRHMNIEDLIEDVSLAGFTFAAHKLKDGTFELKDGMVIREFPKLVSAFGTIYELEYINELKENKEGKIFVNVEYC